MACFNANEALRISARPAVPSVWPMMDFILPTTSHCNSPLVFVPALTVSGKKAELIASASAASPASVPVPWHSKIEGDGRGLPSPGQPLNSSHG